VGVAIEKREQVFVSSTYLDLVEERQAVIQTLLEADCIPAGMELFPASDDDRWTLIRRVIDDYDYYIVVVGGRYGSVDAAVGLSFTEMEFDYAASRGKPIMGFLHGDPDSIELAKSELDADARGKLNAFRQKVEQRMVKYWTSAEGLGGQVAKSLIQIRKTHPAEGWIRARNALTPEIEKELAELRAQVAEITAAEARASLPPDAVGLAQGDDEYVLRYELRYWGKEEQDKVQYLRVTTLVDGDVSVTWNAIFSRLGPLMMDEATESQLDSALDALVVDLFNEQIPFPRNYWKGKSLTADENVLQDVKVQLFSLGLITQSDRRRAVSDTNTYWKLTPYGREQLMRLRAIRRPHIDSNKEEMRRGAE
jgi:hypothetical protein